MNKACKRIRVPNLFFLSILIAGLGWILNDRAAGQTFTNLHSFTATNFSTGTNNDGASPEAGLILLGNTLYGAAYKGGNTSKGSVFGVNTDGTGFTNLHNFVAYTSDGSSPEAGLILSGNTLYGAAEYGGSSRYGTLFSFNTNGSGFTNIYGFTGGSDGAFPVASLIVSGNNLYGTALRGGAAGYGTVFSVNTNGTNFAPLHYFTSQGTDGALPQAGVILSGNALYGTTFQGGSSGNGMVFAVNIDGTGFTNLYSFTGGSDGANPLAGLILSGNTLYGTASGGGSSGNGTVFAVNTNSTGFTNLHSFTAMTGLGVNGDGAVPEAGLILSGNTLYGTAFAGGGSGNGTVFALNTGGTGFTTLYNFTGGNDGANPEASLILSANTLYGTATQGGSSGNGTVFGIFILPQLTLTRSGQNLIFTWPTNVGGLSLQSTPGLTPPVVWSTISNAPVIIGGQNTVTNTLSGPQNFYRLSQ